MDEAERSYYEIALTGGQATSVFLGLLGLLLVAFFCGVWVGRGSSVGADPVPAEVAEAPTPITPQPQVDLRKVAEQPNPSTSLLQDLSGGTAPAAGVAADEGEGVAISEVAPQRPAVPTVAGDSVRVLTGVSSRPPEPEPAAPLPSSPPPSAAEPTSGFVIQVFSSPDGEQAARLVSNLRSDGFAAYLSEVTVGGQSMKRVRIGPFADKEEANRVAGRVKERHRLDGWVTEAGR